MSSNVFFKFTSQREPSRVTFDGTSISVWELKRDIITQSGLGDGTDFDLIITNPDTNEEYDDDTTQLPRSTSVTAKRARPAQGPGRGRAARYLTGKMPTIAKTATKSEQLAASASGDLAKVAASEDENIAALFKETGAQWEQEKARMAEATRVSRSGAPPRPDQNSRGPPPVGYVCHRCRKPGHFIQNCPTNNDTNYDNGPRVKRTTGIPRSFLRTVKEDEEPVSDGLTSEKKTPSNIMVNAEGQRVEAIPDVASWEQYRAKAEASAARKDESNADSQELEERGLACPIDKRLFVDPQKTPCCGRTYCHDCIEAALANSDLVCPNCGEQALFDQLEADEETVKKIKLYQDEKATKVKPAEANKPSKSPSPAPMNDSRKSSTPPTTAASNPKKRRAEEELPNHRQKTTSPPGSKPQSPKTKVRESISSPQPKPASPAVNKSAPTSTKSDQHFEQQMDEFAKQYGFSNPMNGMNAMPMANGFNPYAMSNMSGMSGMPNPAMMQMMQNGMNPFSMGMMGMPNAIAGNNGNMNFNANGNGMGMDGGNWNMPSGGNFNSTMNTNQGIPTGPKAQRGSPFPYQQASRGNDDDAYMRKPLNPHRAAQRGRRARPMDFKEL
ncbi:MAG: hypothetical protein Q9162_004775 [Coniocarpon cinnabarinum]